MNIVYRPGRIFRVLVDVERTELNLDSLVDVSLKHVRVHGVGRVRVRVVWTLEGATANQRRVEVAPWVLRRDG